VSLEWILFGLRLLATTILYIFLGVAFYLIWRQLRQTEAQQTANIDLDQLRVISIGVGQPLVAGQTVLLPSSLILGLSPENMLVINPADTTSGQLRLSRSDGQWWLENLAQSEQVKLNDAFFSESQLLSDGDTVSVDDIQFRFETAQ
jgi:hypothetical protein